MKANVILENIRYLASHGDTSYENCEKLVLLHKALKCLEEEPEAASVEGGHIDSGECSLSNAEIMAWVGAMENADGTTGPHWTMEQTEQVRKQRSIECDPLKFYVTMNMMYSDYCKAAEKTGASSLDFYAYMSKAFLDDKDAQPNKLARYYHFIAK